MASAAAIRNVQQAYIAYYGRGADPAGLDYWANRLDTQGAGQLQNIIDAFATSQEFTLEYGNPSNENEWTTYINKIYQNVLNRDADQAGLNFYLEGLKSGQFTIQNLPLDILNGAINTDILTVNNKTQAALAFTPQIDTPDEILNYNQFSVDIARDWMSSVGPDQQSLDTALAQKPAVIAAIVVAGNPGETFTLTPNEDNLTGTARNDKFVAEVQNVGNDILVNTLQSVDKLDGGTGTDTLTATLNGGSATPSMTSIEVVQVRSTQPGSTLDLGASSGVTTLIASNGTADVVFNNVGQVANFALANQINGPGLASDATFNGSTAETINIGADSWGTADNPGVVVFPGAAATTLNLNIADVRAAVLGLSNVETLSIVSSGVDKLWLLGPDSTAETVTVTGGGTLDLLGGAPGPATPFTAVQTFDASGNNGGVKATISSSQAEVTVTGGAGADTFSVGGADTLAVALGAGDDKLTVTSNPATSGSSYDGGEGFDTFLATTAQLALLGTELGQDAPTVTFTNFEALGVTDVLNAEIDLTEFGVGSVELAGGAAGGTVSGLENDATVTVLAAAAGLTLNQATDTDANSLNLVIGTNADDGWSLTGVVANSVESLIVESNGDGTGANILALAGSEDLTSVTVSGAEDLVFSNADGKLATFDASAAAGDIDASGANYVAGEVGSPAAITITGGAGDDVLLGGDNVNTNTIAGGAGDDEITGGSLADDLSGGDGDDEISAGAGADSVSGGAGDDVLFGEDGNDTMQGGEGDDQLWGGNGADNMTGGGGADVFGYESAVQSQGVNTDTITDFVSGADKLFFDFGADIDFLGNVATSDEATSALDTADTAGSAVFNLQTSQLLVDTTGTGVADMTITLTGVSGLAQDDFVLIS
jgi:Ca2+-binding RTX toxin-like protein